MINHHEIMRALKESWSRKSCSKYNIKNPAAGQCSVTSIVIHMKYGGEILKTKVEDAWHFYNEIDNRIYDFTQEQFGNDIEYMNIRSSIHEALTDCTIEQVQYLWATYNENLETAVVAEEATATPPSGPPPVTW